MTSLAEAALQASRAARQRRLKPWLLLLPVLLFLAVLFLYPLGELLYLSFVDDEGSASFQNYRQIWDTPVWLRVMAITFKISGWTTLFCLLAGYPVAYLLATASERTRNGLMLWVLLPFWTSFLVRTFAWIVILGHKGALNNLLIDLGITDEPLAFIYNFLGTMIGMVHALLPLAILTMVSVMVNLDPNLTRAASTLGARGGQAFWRIYFPLSLPGVAAAGLLVFITSIGFFITPALLGGRKETMISQVIIVQVQELLNWGFAGALSVVLLLAALVIFALYDALFGLSTLSGTSRAVAGRSRRGPVTRLGAVLGDYLLRFLGLVCEWAGRGLDLLLPRRAERPRRALGRGVLWVAGLTIVAFLVLPAIIVVPVSLTAGQFVTFPPEGFSWRWYDTYLNSAVWVEATIRSFAVAGATGVLAMLLGVPAAFALSRTRIPASGGLVALILSPLIIPRIVVAVAVYFLYARVGLVGTSVGLVLGHAILAVPYVVVTMLAVLKTYDERYDQAAWSLGARPWRALLKVTFPLIRGGMIASFLFAFITSFDELTISLFVSGGLVSTLPRQMWNDMILQVNPTLAAVSTVMLVLITGMILIAEFVRRRSTR